jgi:cytochrome c peroxidase
MNVRFFVLLSLAVVLMAFITAKEYRFVYPNHFPAPTYDFKNNSLDSATISLGRILFYDPILSKDNSISCASCHSPYNAFAHTDHELSHGIKDQIGTRNAPALFNLAWQSTFMWDGAINHLDVQALAPISHPKEMAEDIKNVVKKLGKNPFYAKLFFKAFRDSTITGERLLKALSQFQLTLVSANAKYDKVINKQDSFNKQEQKGYRLFLKYCNSCHKEPLFSNYTFANNGLAIDSTLNDYGKGAINHKTEDSLLFKIPSLRNLAYSLPYMHDGRFKTLNQVLKHYTNGIKASKNLSKELERNIILNSNEQIDLIAFLLTLNDSSFVFDTRHQFPKILLEPREGSKE